jgi:hypothetical protein
MPAILLFTPFLRRVSDGKFFRAAFPIFFRGCAGLAALGALYGSYLLWRTVTREMGFNGFLALVLTQLLLLALGLVAVNVLWLRAEDAEAVTPAEGIVTSMVAIALRALGEVLGAAQVIGGVAIAVLGWLNEGWAAQRIFGPFWVARPTDGLLAIVLGFVNGFAVLAIGYFVAEQASALVAVERNTRRSRAS